MDHIFSSINSSLHRKQYDTHLIARVALNELAKFLGYTQLEGYIRYSILYVDLPNEEDNIVMFQNKSSWLVTINKNIQIYDPKKTLRDIRYKKIRNSD